MKSAEKAKQVEQAAYNAYMREYLLKRYHDRHARAVAMLGSVCVKCKKTKSLSLCRKNPAETKHLYLHGISEERFLIYVHACELLCQKHLTERAASAKGHTMARGTHGTVSSVRYCKPLCEPCRLARNKANRRRKSRAGQVVSEAGSKSQILGSVTVD